MNLAITDYTESEFLTLIQNAHSGIASDQEVEDLVGFLDTTTYPEGSALLTHPRMIGVEDTPEAIILELKRWYDEQGLPCFKE